MRKLVNWGMLVIYVGVLFWMSRYAWQNTHFFWFFSFLFGMPAVILLAFRSPKEKG